MVKLIRHLYLEAKKSSTQNNQVTTTKQIKSKLQSFLNNDLYPLSDTLDDKVQSKITLSSGVKLEDLYTTVTDADNLENMIREEKENSPLSPAYTISHIHDVEPGDNGITVRYKDKDIVNPRLFYLLNKQFNAINKKYKEFKVSLSFEKESYTHSYSLYYESVDYPMYLTLNYNNTAESKRYSITDSFVKPIEDLQTPTMEMDSIKKKIKELESFLDLFGKENTALVRKRKEELESLYQTLHLAEYNNTVSDSIVKTLNVIKQHPLSNTAKLKDGIDTYRNEETAILAINKSNLSRDDNMQSHIVVSLHLKRKGKRYEITCYANPLDTTKDLHIDNQDHLVL